MGIRFHRIMHYDIPNAFGEKMSLFTFHFRGINRT